MVEEDSKNMDIKNEIKYHSKIHPKVKAPS